MKIIQKLTLGLLTVVAFSTSTSAANLIMDVEGTDVATNSGVLTGTGQKIGTGTLIMSGANSASLRDLQIDAGIVRYGATGDVGAQVTFNGGNLETTAAADFPALVMNVGATVTALDAGALAGLSGFGKLTLAGVGPVTPANLGGSNTAMDISGVVHVGATAGHILPNAAVNVLSGGLVKIEDAGAGCAPGTNIVKNGATLQVDPSLTVPAAGGSSSTDLFGTLQFDSDSTLKLGNNAVWQRAITVGSAL
jgi:hypothetical protein